MAVGDSPIPLRDDKAQYQGLQLDPVTGDLRAYNPAFGAWQVAQAGVSGQQQAQSKGTSAILAQNFDITEWVTSNLAAITTDTALATPIFLRRGVTYTNMIALTGDTALTAGTHYVWGLYDNAATPNRVASTADQTNGAITANTFKTLAFATAYTSTFTGWAQAAVSFTSGGVCTLEGIAARNTAAATGPTNYLLGSQTFGSALAGVLPATLTGGTVAQKRFWVALT